MFVSLINIGMHILLILQKLPQSEAAISHPPDDITEDMTQGELM